MNDPFRMSGPTCINVSGGRTSAFMLRKILDAHNGYLPPDCFAVFANTGDEREETLAFLAEIERRWCSLEWIERRGDADNGFAEVSFETASRHAEPFEELIQERRFLPHHGARICTQEMKIETARSFMLSRGFEHWTSVVGLRFDEPSRVAKHREKQVDETDFDSVYPLHRARYTKADVMEFWSARDFDLGLRAWESNCRMCFLKSAAILERTERDAPGSLAWAARMEYRTGATFVKGRRYLQLIERAQRPMLPSLATALTDADEHAPIACNCTDRRAPRRCTCGKRRGQGHALHCGHVMGLDPKREAA